MLEVKCSVELQTFALGCFHPSHIPMARRYNKLRNTYHLAESNGGDPRSVANLYNSLELLLSKHKFKRDEYSFAAAEDLYNVNYHRKPGAIPKPSTVDTTFFVDLDQLTPAQHQNLLLRLVDKLNFAQQQYLLLQLIRRQCEHLLEVLPILMSATCSGLFYVPIQKKLVSALTFLDIPQ